MIYTINIEMNKPNTCFDCIFSKKEYCWAKCPFINKISEDGKPIPKNCPLKEKNKNKIYKFNIDIH